MVVDELPFINRKRDIEILSEIVNSRLAEEQILVVSAESGIGKTRLVDRVLEGYRRTPVFHVRTVDHPQFVVEQGAYLQSTFRAIAETADKDSRLLHFSTFRKERRGLSTLGIVAKGALVHVSKKYLGDNAASVVADATGKLIRENSPSNDLELYALDILEQNPCLIRIENLQKIDAESLNALCRILETCRNVCAIFEYTEKSPGAVPFETIQATCRNYGLRLNAYHVAPIAIEELFESLKDFPDILFGALKQHYEAEGGNLRVLIDLRVWIDNQSRAGSDKKIDIGELNTTRAVLRSLGNPSRLLLALVAVHGGDVDAELVNAALAALPVAQAQSLGVVDAAAIIKELCAIQYLAQSESRLRIAHDSVTAALIDDPANAKMLALARTIWIDLYRSIADAGDPFVPATEALHWLALLYSAANQVEQLLWVFERCGHAALESLAPKRVVALFDQIADRAAERSLRIEPSRLDQLLEYQGEILYDANWLNEACACFERAGKLRLSARLMYADSCISANRSDIGFATLDLLEEEHAGERLSGPVHFRTGLIRLHGLRSAGQLEECETLFCKMLKLEKELPAKQRAFLQRSADVGLYRDDDIPEAMRYLEESIAVCEQLELRADEAAARLALCQHLGYAGRLDEAQAQLDKAEALAKRVWIEQYSLLNNRAVISLLRGDDQHAAAAMLIKALMLATEDGDQLLILANLLGAGHDAATPQLARLVEDIPDLSDELAKIAHYNLSVRYLDHGDEASVERHRAKAAAMKDEPDSQFWRSAIDGAPAMAPGVQLRLSRRYCLTFIVHWRLSHAPRFPRNSSLYFSLLIVEGERLEVRPSADWSKNFDPQFEAELEVSNLEVETGGRRARIFPVPGVSVARLEQTHTPNVGEPCGFRRRFLRVAVGRKRIGTVGWGRTTDLRIHNPAL
jgi:tetratricopeptide (TPR) repeat protein